MAARELEGSLVSMQYINTPSILNCLLCEAYVIETYRATRCGHCYCKNCYKGSDDRPMKCTQCAKVLADCVVSYDERETRDRREMELYCQEQRHGCKWRGIGDNLQKHIDEDCLFSKTACGACKLKVRNKDLPDHKTNHCTSRIVACQHCNSQMEFFKLEYHTIPCPRDCSETLKLCKSLEVLAKHEDECPCYEVPCIFAEMGCAEKVERGKMDSHTCNARHMEMLANHSAQQNNRLSEENRNLKEEKQHLLEQIECSNKNHAARVSALEEQVVVLADGLKSCQASVSALTSNVATLESSLKVSISKHFNRASQEDVTFKKQMDSLQKKIDAIEETMTFKADHQWLIDKTYKQFENVFDLCKMEEETLERLENNYKQLTGEFDQLCQSVQVARRGFSVENFQTLSNNDKWFTSPPFYTDCLKHKLQFHVYPSGTEDGKNTHVSVWVRRLEDFGTVAAQLLNRVVINIGIELVNQVPSAVKGSNYSAEIQAVLEAGRGSDIVAKKNKFISINELGQRNMRVHSAQVPVRYMMFNRLHFVITFVKEMTQ